MTKYLALSIILFSFGVSADIEGSACVPDSGNRYIDEITAKAKAKGALSHELGATVTAKTRLETVTEESANNIQTKDVLTEEINLKSKHQITGVQTVFSDYKLLNGERYYCVELTQ
ncbi:hypothetical protein BIT28_24610 [Photobacterium proteolyticum]|uniref:DUF3316 domain-containing protein n=1 Tax=Photobacterium proteolyticum TaxID=1903952 RepID=A0A1Q9GCS6_9GAMM|nr:hypothetical protein [Photobacterium proteolyticum]OLQ72205.1 hypothetical protein BIT28_24610 [Photobacterium proteolyticum]